LSWCLLGKWNYRAIPKVKTEIIFLTILRFWARRSWRPEAQKYWTNTLVDMNTGKYEFDARIIKRRHGKGVIWKVLLYSQKRVCTMNPVGKKGENEDAADWKSRWNDQKQDERTIIEDKSLYIIQKMQIELKKYHPKIYIMRKTSERMIFCYIPCCKSFLAPLISRFICNKVKFAGKLPITCGTKVNFLFLGARKTQLNFSWINKKDPEIKRQDNWSSFLKKLQ
jgi:hypothetical protein